MVHSPWNHCVEIIPFCQATGGADTAHQYTRSFEPFDTVDALCTRIFKRTIILSVNSNIGWLECHFFNVCTEDHSFTQWGTLSPLKNSQRNWKMDYFLSFFQPLYESTMFWPKIAPSACDQQTTTKGHPIRTRPPPKQTYPIA